jgi:hypothetical protein
VIKPNENKEDWKSVTQKIHKLKIELNASLKELEGKIYADRET